MVHRYVLSAAVAHIYRDVAAGRPGPISKIGLGTFVDPREGGGKVNGPHQTDAVELLTLGDEFLNPLLHKWLCCAMRLNMRLVIYGIGALTGKQEHVLSEEYSVAHAFLRAAA